MKYTRLTHSLFQVSRQTMEILTSSQRAGVTRSTAGSILIASFEVLSLTAIIPLFLNLINSSGNQLPRIFTEFMSSVSWQSILISIILIFIAKNLIILRITKYQSQFIHKIFTNLCERLYRRFYSRSWTDYLQDNSAETVRKIKNTPSDFTNYVLQGYLNLITDLVICFLMLGVLIWVDFRIVLVILLLSLPIVLLYFWFRKNILTKIHNSFCDLTPKANVVLTQGIDGFAEAKIYQKENFFIDSFMSFNETTSQHLADLKLFTNIPARLFEMVGIISFSAVIVYSKLFPGYQENTIVLIGLLSIAIYRVMPSLNRLLLSLSQIQAYSYSVDELRNSFSIETKYPETNTENEISFKETIRLQNVSFQYTDNASEALFKDLNLTIHKGDFVVIEGPSGTGKTTLIHILTGLMSNYNGTITIDNIALSPTTLKGWQKKLGFVPQASVILQESVLQNIAFGEEDDQIDIPKANAALKLAGLFDFIHSLPSGLQTHTGENGLTLSGGQRQRLMLTRALYRNPEILLLDEVTNQLDESNKLLILESLKTLSRQGKTIIMVSHDPHARNFANRLLTVQDKKIQEAK